MQSLWIYIWRFQPFHNGHKKVVETMLWENQKNMIILGTLDTDTEKNIYSPEWRKEVIQEIFPQVDIQTLADNPDDEKWIDSLKKILQTQDTDYYIFYCWDRKNDYAIQVIEKYRNLFTDKNLEFREISRKILPLSGTEIREKLKSTWEEAVENDVPKEVYKKIKKL